MLDDAKDLAARGDVAGARRLAERAQSFPIDWAPNERSPENFLAQLDADSKGRSKPSSKPATAIAKRPAAPQSGNGNSLANLETLTNGKPARNSIAPVIAQASNEESFDESADEPLEEVVTLPIQHISAYGLQVEDGTSLAKLITQGRMTVADNDTNADEYDQAVSFLAQCDFDRYEISNFAKAGYDSRHNMNYWQQGATWAFGVGAHGFLLRSPRYRSRYALGSKISISQHDAFGFGVSTPSHIRYENTDSLTQYLANPTQRAAEHVVDDTEHLENTLIFGLRTRDGVDLSQFNAEESALFETTLRPRLEKHIADGWVTLKDNRLQLASHAFVVSNSILSELTT